MSVEEWLENLGLAKYATVFAAHDIDLEVLAELSDADLVEIGVASLGHRKKILKAAKEAAHPAAPEPRAQAVQAPKPREAERRQLTVLFCDMVGSTTLSARFDPEEVGIVFGKYQDAVAAVVKKFGGFVANYLGDGIVAYFGYPTAHENDPERAVRAALEIVEAVGAQSDPVGKPLSCRVGIATGLVVVGDVFGATDQQNSVVGETPNLAARLQAVAAPGQVIVSPVTRNLLPSSVRSDKLYPIELKGIAEPITPFVVTSIVETTATALDAGDGPIFGRDPEAALLRTRWQAARDGDAQLVLLSGQAGIGKSRLAAAFIDEVSREDARVNEYFGSSFHTASAYHPIAIAIERAAEIAREDDPATRLDKLDKLMVAAGLDPDEAGPFIAPLLGVDPGTRYPSPGIAPSAMSDRAFELLADMLLFRWRDKPHLVLLEDAHWIDPTTTELLHHLFARAEGMRVLFLVTFRPDYEGLRRDTPVNKTLIELTRLPRTQGLELIKRVCGGRKLPEKLIDHIIDRTDGVPLYVEEMTKSILDSVDLVERDGRLELSAPLTSLAIPSTLKDSLMSRLDKLSPVKQIAQVSSVLGRRFSRSLLSTVAEAGTAELDFSLKQLVDAELLYVSGGNEDPIYTFKHALIRDAAYESMLNSRRAELHRRAAEALVASFAEQTETQPQVVAAHFERAGKAERAAEYWLKSGRKAMAASAMTEALSHLERGLAMLDRVADENRRKVLGFGLHSAMGLAQISLKGWHAMEVEQHLQPAFELGEQVGQNQDLLMVIYGLWIHWLNRADFERSAAWIEQAERRAVAGDNEGWPLVIHTMKLVQERWCGSHAGVHEQAEKVLSLYDPAAHSHFVHMFGNDPKVLAYGFRSWSQWLEGDTAAALSDTAECETASLAVGHPFDRCWQLLVGSLAYYFTGDRDSLARNLAEAKELAEAQNVDFVNYVVGPVWTGLLHILDKKWDAAIAAMTPGIEVWKATGGGVILPFWEGSLAVAHAGAGRREVARDLLDGAIARAEETGETWYLPELHRLLGGVLAGADESGARQSLARARALAEQSGALEVARRVDADLSQYAA
ncbi:MAG: adenylate/guanylate cyclase domain-containing protein [Pseudomonadota bacterium]